VFGRRLRIARVFGIDVQIDASWLLIALLISWSLATGQFATELPELSSTTRWLMGAGGALFLLVSVLLHELGHALTAMRFDVKTRGITLFLFGGVAELESEPPTPVAEFWIAIAGPLTSVVLAGIFYGASSALGGTAGAEPVAAVIAWAGWLNAMLASFNLVPAFPLDGGRVLRSILWGVKKNLAWATRVTSRLGTAFGIALIAFGVLNVISGNFLGGMWLFLIGMFLKNAAESSYQAMVTRLALEGEPVSRFMATHPISVASGITVERFVEDWVYRTHHRLFPVVDDGALLGAIHAKQVITVPRERWPALPIAQLVEPVNADNALPSSTPALDALVHMQRTGRGRLLVVDDGELRGVLTLKDLMSFLTLKIELEGGAQTTDMAA
jgi:Zn-dependent protease